jgi:hypothetical protein
MAVKPFDEAIDIPIDNVLDPEDVFNNMCVMSFNAPTTFLTLVQNMKAISTDSRPTLTITTHVVRTHYTKSKFHC